MKTRILLATLLGCAMLTTGMFGAKADEPTAPKEISGWKKFGRAAKRDWYAVKRMEGYGAIKKELALDPTGIQDLQDKVDMIAMWINDDLNSRFQLFPGMLRSKKHGNPNLTAPQQFVTDLIQWTQSVPKDIDELATTLNEHAKKLDKEISRKASKQDMSITIDSIRKDITNQVEGYKKIVAALGKALQAIPKDIANFDVNKFNITYGDAPAAPAAKPEPVIAPAPASATTPTGPATGTGEEEDSD